MTSRVRRPVCTQHDALYATRSKLHDDTTASSRVGEKEAAKKSKDAVQKSKAKEDKKAQKSKLKQIRRALLKKGVKYEVGCHVSVPRSHFCCLASSACCDALCVLWCACVLSFTCVPFLAPYSIATAPFILT